MKKITKNEKEPTLRDLAKLVIGVSQDVENLATITKQGFERVDRRFEKVEWVISDIKKDLNIVKTDVAVIKTDLRTVDAKYPRAILVRKKVLV